MDDNAARRRTSLVWGGIAVACLGGPMVAWLTGPSADDAAFGRVGSLTVGSAAVVLTVTATAATTVSARTSRGLRWAVALPLAIAAGGVAVLALQAFLGSGEPSDVALGVSLGVAVVGMNVVATQVARPGVPDRGRR